VPRDPSDKDNDVYYGHLDPAQAALMEGVIAADTGTGSNLDVAVTNPHSTSNGKMEPFPAVLVYEFKQGINAYLKAYLPDAPVHSLNASSPSISKAARRHCASVRTC
jgi:hypothetical protein